MHKSDDKASGRRQIAGTATGTAGAGEPGSALRRRMAGRDRMALAVAGIATAAALIGGVAAAALPPSAPTTSTHQAAAVSMLSASSSSGTDKGRMCGADVFRLKRDYDSLPDAMRKDLAAARHESSKTARHDAYQSVLKRAQSGGYGSAVEAAAKDKKTIAGVREAWDRLPSALRTDLKAARAASGDARINDVKAIVSKAESGGYGDRVKAAADKEKTRLDTCVSRLSTPKTPKTSSTSTPAPSASTGA